MSTLVFWFCFPMIFLIAFLLLNNAALIH